MVQIVAKNPEIVRLSKKEIVYIKTTINPNDKKSNYFLFRKVEPFPHYCLYLKYQVVKYG